VIELKTFDAHTGQYLLDSKSQPIVEFLRHSILEYLYEGESFSLAEIDDRTTAEDLQKNAPDGQVLLASSSGKFLFGRPEIRDRLDEVFPHLPEQGLFGIKDRSAYGALLLSDCTAKGERLRVLLVDDDDRQFGAEAARTMADFKATGRLLVDVPPGVFAGYEPGREPQLVLPASAVQGAKISIGNHLASVQDIAESLNIADRSIEVAPRHLQRKLRVLIVDDETGANGGFLSSEAALALTGDCHGKMSPELASSKFGIDDKTAIQFRGLLNIDDRYPDSFGTNKVCKGGIVAQDLTKLEWNGCEPPDIILAKSSFKGSVKPKVGLYEDKDIWLGEKDRSRTGTQSISSLLGLYPNAIKDVMPILQPKIEELAGAQNDLRSIAKLYCKSFELRLPKYPVLVVDDTDPTKAAEIAIARQTMAGFRETGKLSLGDSGAAIQGVVPQLILLKSDVDKLPIGSHDLHVANIAQALKINTADVLSPVKAIVDEVEHVDEEGKPVEDYQISTERYDHIKAILDSGNDALLQSGLAAPELRKFLRKQWLNLAEGKDNDVKFDRGFCVPDKGLADGEICVPWLPEGAEIIIYRAPLINTNGVHILKNNHLGNDYSDPKHRPNFILTSDAEIAARGHGQSVMADFGLDFDGDCVAVAEASRFPNLATDVVKAQLPANRYLDVVKEPKTEFEGDQESACLQMRNNLVGRIANVLTRLQSQITEVDIVADRSKSSQDDRTRLAGDIHKKICSLWFRAGKVTGRDGSYCDPVQPLVKIPDNLSEANQEWFTNLTQKIERQVEAIYKSYSNQPDRIFDLYRETLRDLVDVAAYQNQIALDMQKSARKADVEAVTECNKFTTHQLDILHEKKSQATYAGQEFTINGATPQELLAHNTNSHFQATMIQAERPFCFQELFDTKVPVGVQAVAVAFKREFDILWYEGAKHLSKAKNEEGCVLAGQTETGFPIEFTNLCKFEHSLAYDAAALMKANDFTIDFNDRKCGESIRTNHAYVVSAFDPAIEKYRAIGTVCEFTKTAVVAAADAAKMAESSEPQSIGFKLASLQLSAPLPDLSSQYFDRARELAQNFANSVPEGQREVYAAALWQASCEDEGKLVTTLNVDNDSLNRISPAIIYAFSTELNDRVNESSLRTHKLKVNSPLSPEEIGQPLYFKCDRAGLSERLEVANQNARADEPTDLLKFASKIQVSSDGVDFYDLGQLQQHSLPLNPNGEIFTGQILPVTSATMRLQVPGIDEPLIFGKVNEYALAGKAWADRPAKISLAKMDTPSYSLTIVDRSGAERSIGKVSGDGMKFLESQDLLKTGQKLNAKITPLSNGVSMDVEIPLPDGNKLNFRTSQPEYKGTSAGEIVEIKLVKQNAYSVGVYLGHGDDRQQIGEFTNVTNSDKAVRKLIEAGYIEWTGFTSGRSKLGSRTSQPVIKQPEFEAVLSGSSKDFALVLDSAGVDRPLVPKTVELDDSLQSRLCQYYLPAKVPVVESEVNEPTRTKIVISGSRSIQSLPTEAKERIDTIVKSGAEILVGDAPGIDLEVQRYLKSIDYDRVTVHHAYDKARNNEGFPTQGGYASYSHRDRVMCESADYGLVVWDGQSKGSKANIDRVPSRVVMADRQSEIVKEVEAPSATISIPAPDPQISASEPESSKSFSVRRSRINFDDLPSTVSISISSADRSKAIDAEKIALPTKVPMSSGR
jgi:hypothetical protein